MYILVCCCKGGAAIQILRFYCLKSYSQLKPNVFLFKVNALKWMPGKKDAVKAVINLIIVYKIFWQCMHPNKGFSFSVKGFVYRLINGTYTETYFLCHSYAKLAFSKEVDGCIVTKF